MKFIQHKKIGQGGFSILEGILSTLLLSLTLLGGVFLMQNAMMTSAYSDINVVASHLANEKLESILADKAMKGAGYTDITDVNYPSENLDYNSASNVFQRTVAVSEVSPTDLTTPQAGSGFKKVDVTVSWGSGYSRNIQVSTLLTDY